MSRFDLKILTDRLAAARDVESLVDEFLRYLQAERADWRPTLAFYDVSRDSLVDFYRIAAGGLVHQNLALPVDKLPPRLVRKFFQPNAFSNGEGRRGFLGAIFQKSPFYEPDSGEQQALKPLLALEGARSCICLPLGDQEDLIALLTLTCERKGAFGGREADEIVPLKNVVALALARHSYRSARQTAANVEPARPATAEVEDKLRKLHEDAAALEEQNRAKAGQIEALHRELQTLQGDSGQYEQELEGLKFKLRALEEQSSAAAEHLREAQVQVSETLNRAADLQRTLRFMKEVLQVLGQEYDGDSYARTIVTWFCEHFHVDRCSLMLYDESRQTLQIGAYRGMDAGVAGKVRVKVGQGISGWVAHHRKPLHVRVKNDQEPSPHTGQDDYNSDSFVSVPLVYGNRLSGVLNLSNKHGGVPFTEMDLDRATLVGSVLAMILTSRDVARRGAVAS